MRVLHHAQATAVGEPSDGDGTGDDAQDAHGGGLDVGVVVGEGDPAELLLLLLSLLQLLAGGLERRLLRLLELEELLLERLLLRLGSFELLCHFGHKLHGRTLIGVDLRQFGVCRNCTLWNRDRSGDAGTLPIHLGLSFTSSRNHEGCKKLQTYVSGIYAPLFLVSRERVLLRKRNLPLTIMNLDPETMSQRRRES